MFDKAMIYFSAFIYYLYVMNLHCDPFITFFLQNVNYTTSFTNSDFKEGIWSDLNAVLLK